MDDLARNDGCRGEAAAVAGIDCCSGEAAAARDGDHQSAQPVGSSDPDRTDVHNAERLLFHKYVMGLGAHATLVYVPLPMAGVLCDGLRAIMQCEELAFGYLAY